MTTSALSFTDQQVQDLRNAFLQELQNKGGDSIVHPNDLARANTDDAWLKRYLGHHEGDQKLAMEMMFEVMEWRKSFKVNEINENNIRMDYMVEGGFFTRGRDKDGAAIFIFKCKKHTKGTKEMDSLKKCVVYWFERLERQEKGKPITLFFDMEGCGLSNMDMEFTKYLIGLFKQYYPYFLNYIIIYEMAWILNAAFKVIKSWLPEKAVQKIKMVKKNDLNQWVAADQALTCWGGQDDYVFSFVPEVSNNVTSTPVSSKKVTSQVHFADGSPMTDTPGSLDREASGDGSVLSVTPSTVITFVKDGDEFVSTLDLQNTDASANVSYKMKTTAPEKFRVRPSAGVLGPGDKATIAVTLLPAYQIGGLAKDKFLVMSIPVESIHMSPQDLAELWKNTSGKNITQHRLRCAQAGGDISRNGSAIAVSSTGSDHSQILKLSSSVAQLQECQMTLHKAVRNTQVLQFVTMSLVVLIAIALFYVIRYVLSDGTYTMGSTCQRGGGGGQEL